MRTFDDMVSKQLKDEELKKNMMQKSQLYNLTGLLSGEVVLLMNTEIL